MAEFFAQNIGTIIVLLIVAAVVVAIVVKLVKDKRMGKSTCGGKCGCCPNSALCHKNTH